MIVMMRAMIVRIVRMRRVRMPVAAFGIGPTFRIERCLDLDHARAKAQQHILDDVITANAQSLRHNLRRQMTISEMPGDTHEMMRIMSTNLKKWLWRSDNFNQPIIFQYQRVAAAQRDSLRQVEQKFKSARACHHHAATMPIIKIEHDGVGGLALPMACLLNSNRTHQNTPGKTN